MADSDTREGTTLLVALSDPLNFRAIDEIGLQTGRMVRAIIVTEGAMQRALLKVFGVPDLDGQESTKSHLRPGGSRRAEHGGSPGQLHRLTSH